MVVSARQAALTIAAEFFELFKTPWEPARCTDEDALFHDLPLDRAPRWGMYPGPGRHEATVSPERNRLSRRREIQRGDHPIEERSADRPEVRSSSSRDRPGLSGQVVGSRRDERAQAGGRARAGRRGGAGRPRPGLP